jgi:hypothetical protein
LTRIAVWQCARPVVKLSADHFLTDTAKRVSAVPDGVTLSTLVVGRTL